MVFCQRHLTLSSNGPFHPLFNTTIAFCWKNAGENIGYSIDDKTGDGDNLSTLLEVTIHSANGFRKTTSPRSWLLGSTCLTTRPLLNHSTVPAPFNLLLVEWEFFLHWMRPVTRSILEILNSE
jgi:hypothetical protein